MVVKCEIDFNNNPEGIYFVEQTVTGTVTLNADQPEQVKAVLLRIVGYAHTQWPIYDEHNKGDGIIKRNPTYQAHKDYFTNLTYLLGSKGSQIVTIEQGTQVFPFSCPIPFISPTSFEGKNGHVRYAVQVVLEYPGAHDLTFMRCFTVLKLLFYQREEAIKQVAERVYDRRTFYVGPYKEDRLKILLYLPRRLYVSGQSVQVSVLVRNDAGLDIDAFNVTLYMLVNYTAHSPKRQSREERVFVSQYRDEGVAEKTNKLLEYELPVTATPSSFAELCKLIQITYEVELEVKILGLHCSQFMSVPVTIINEPLMDVNGEPKVGGEEYTTLPPWEANTKLRAPTYEKSPHMIRARITDDSKHIYGQNDFTPDYPVFKIYNPSWATENDLEKLLSETSEESGIE